MSSRFIHAIACFRISFLFQAEQYSIVWIYRILFIHSPFSGGLCCFHLLATVNIGAMNTSVQISVQVPAFTSLEYTELELLDHMVILCFVTRIWLKIVGQSFCRISFSLVLTSFFMVRLRLCVLTGMSRMLFFFLLITPHRVAHDVYLVIGIFF